MNDITPYDADFHAWAVTTARALREGRWENVDTSHVADELESMGASERRELLHRLQALLLHLLKHAA